jgi:hypothetical protein
LDAGITDRLLGKKAVLAECSTLGLSAHIGTWEDFGAFTSPEREDYPLELQ